MKKHHWHVFRHEKLFEKQPLPHCQIRLETKPSLELILISLVYIYIYMLNHPRDLFEINPHIIMVHPNLIVQNHAS